MSSTLRSQCPGQQHMAYPSAQMRLVNSQCLILHLLEISFVLLSNVEMMFTRMAKKYEEEKKTAVFFIMLESMWICPTPAAGECRAVYLTLL